MAFAFATATWLSFVLPLQAQEAGLDVTVTDSSGAVVPGSTVRIESTTTGLADSVVTGTNGHAVLEVAGGNYRVSVAARGFIPWTGRVNAKDGALVPISAQLAVSNGCGPCVDVQPSASHPELADSSVRELLAYSIPKKSLRMVAAYAARPDAPDLILYNGTILTGKELNGQQPQIVSAIAVRDGLVLATGNDAEIKAMTGPSTKLRDLHGAFVMPGLNDAHVHLGGAGQTKLNVDLTGSQSLKEMLFRIAEKAHQSPSGHWLTGGGWDHTLWATKTLPTRQDLDKVTGDHPALLERIDGHIAIANTAALKAANITGKSPAPQGGAIDLDAQGEPTGILRDTAMEQFEKIIPGPTHEDRRQGLALAIQDAISHGLTSLQDNSEWDDFLVFEDFEGEGKLPVRISEWLPFDAPVSLLVEHRKHHDLSDPMLHTGMLKGFMDGSLGSRTAAMKAPYADDPSNSGLARYDQAKLDAMAVERAKVSFQIGFHAIGDKANAMALNAFSLAEAATHNSTARNRIEHAQVVDPIDIPRFAKLGVIASMQPNHLLTDMNWAEDRLGPKRAKSSYSWKAFLEAGVVVAFGTDYPVEPVTPFRGLYAAVTRANEAGTKTYFPDQSLTRTQALYAYTQGSAYAEQEEKTKGILAPGYMADYILLDRNLLTCPAKEILKIQVLETVVGGKTVYHAQ